MFTLVYGIMAPIWFIFSYGWEQYLEGCVICAKSDGWLVVADLLLLVQISLLCFCGVAR